MGLAVRIFPATTRTFTKDTTLSEHGRGAAWQGNGMGTACYVRIGLKDSLNSNEVKKSLNLLSSPSARIYGNVFSTSCNFALPFDVTVLLWEVTAYDVLCLWAMQTQCSIV